MTDSTGNNDPQGQPAQPDPHGGQQPPSTPPPASQPYGQQPGAASPYGQPPVEQSGYGQPPAYGQQPSYDQQGYGYAPQADPEKRPATVTAAGIITLIFSGISLVLFVIVLVAFLVARDMMVEEMGTTPGLEGIDPGDVITVTVAVMVVFALWCVLAMVLAVFAMRRSNGARIGLVVSSALAAVLSLLSIASIFSGLPLIACIVTIVCLFAGGANQWFSRDPSAQSGGWSSSPVA